MNDPVSSAVQDVVDLFSKELAHVRFGDLEGGVLVAFAEEVKVSASEVTNAEALLETARARLTERQDALLQKAQRALAYARVYAEGQPELAERIERIALPRAVRRSTKMETNVVASDDAQPLAAAVARRRGRATRMDPGATLLALPTDATLDPPVLE
jgi:ElaB/YqjD/DUF883 family membrane-anchored ribosome-binding protein